ncbi:hypothetical protein NBRC116493_25250 [Aurantivibrio infirmus]
MKKKLILAIGASFLLSASNSFSDSRKEATTIEKISTNSSGKIYISLDRRVNNACGDSDTFLLPNGEGKIYYRALSAYTKGEKISIRGTGTCSGEHEFIRSITRAIET